MSGSTQTRIPRARLLALVVLCAATLMTIVDETVVSVALPSIQRDLGFATSDLSWVVNAYLASFGGLLLLSGRIGDLVGRRRVLLGGLSLFIAASMLCGVAQSPGWLVAARFLQGAGGALAASVALGMVVSLFDDPGLQARCDRDLLVRRRRGRLDRALPRGRHHGPRRLALGLLHQHPDRHRDRAGRQPRSWPSRAAPGCARAPTRSARCCSWRA